MPTSNTKVTILTIKQIDLMSKWLAASNVGTMTDKRKAGEPLADYIRRYWQTAVENHDCEGIDIGPEALDFVKELRNPKKNMYWVDQLKKEFGDNALEELV